MIQECLPSSLSCPKETKDLIGECCLEFIHLISSESTEICEKELKKTITGDHVISALKSLGFEDYIDRVKEAFQEHSKSVKDREKKTFRLENSGLTPEELLKSQEELFARARQRFAQQSAGTEPSSASMLPSPLPAAPIQLPPSIPKPIQETENAVSGQSTVETSGASEQK